MARLGSSRHPAVILGAVLLIASAACTEPRSELAALADTPDATRPGVETAPAPPESDLYLIDPRTGAAEVLLRAPGAQTNAELSPDGERVVYESWLDDTAQIFVLDRDGTAQQLTDVSGGGYDPTWSPTGARSRSHPAHGRDPTPTSTR